MKSDKKKKDLDPKKLSTILENAKYVQSVPIKLPFSPTPHNHAPATYAQVRVCSSNITYNSYTIVNLIIGSLSSYDVFFGIPQSSQ